jgi:hypothetical protein
MWLPYIKVVFVSIMHQRSWKCEFHSFFLCVYLTRQNLKGRRHGMMVALWSNRNRWSLRFSCYSYCSASSKSHLPYSTTPGACSNMAVWYLVACCIWCLACIAPNLLNCISLAYTLYMWIWHAFLFLLHTTSAYHTMFLHQTTVLVYPASIAYDETVTRVG